MKKILVWLELALKRLLLRKGFLALLIALPLLGLFTGYWQTHHTQGVEAGLLKSADPTAQAAISRLLANDGMFTFILYEQESELLDAVKTRQLETAFIFAPDLTRRLDEGETRNLVRLIRSPATVTHGMAAEIIFSELLNAATPDIIRDLVTTSGLFQGQEAKVSDEILAKYNAYEESGGTFQFNYEYLDGVRTEEGGIPLFPLKGLLAMFIMLTAWINVLNWYKDQEDGVYGAFSVSFRKLASMISIYLPVFLMTLAGLGLLLAVYPAGLAFREFLYLLIYGVSISLFLYGIKFFFRTPIAFGALLPAALLGSLAASPVILDLSSLISNLDLLEKLFFPSYYLGLSAGFQTWALAGLLIMAIAGILLILIEDRRTYHI